ncbi:MAG TPA: SDR family NAD(P)-dependent oxidoreductase [Acidobacteriaceae bacterium]|nr:SDR family NAD(P)-dependent oxidoreductase [Acidobacteriaceae bacterium]
MKSLAGKIMLITGASSGIGRATAFAFAQQGARLLLCARRLELLQEVEGALVKAGAAAVLLLQLDVRERDAVAAAIRELPAEWSEIEVLVNNAGLSRGLTKVYEDDLDDWDEMIDTNVKGLLYVTRAVVPGMVKRGAGHVINLGSTAGHMTYANGAVYCATKAGEKAISEGLKLDLMGTAVRVTSVDPGMVETEFSRVRFHGDEVRAAKVYENFTPLVAEDVADAIVWAATRPDRVNVHTILLTSVDQANSMVVHRRG